MSDRKQPAGPLVQQSDSAEHLLALKRQEFQPFHDAVQRELEQRGAPSEVAETAANLATEVRARYAVFYPVEDDEIEV